MVRENLVVNYVSLSEEKKEISFSNEIWQNYFCEYDYNIHTYLAQTPEIGQGLGCILSCGARKQEQT